LLFFLFFLQNFLTVVNVVDSAASGVVDVVSATIHFTTYLITKKKYFD